MLKMQQVKTGPNESAGILEETWLSVTYYHIQLTPEFLSLLS